MAPPVFHVDELPAVGEAVLDGPEGRHAATVRRLRVGERLLLTDGRGGLGECAVTGVGRGHLDLQVLSTRQVAPAAPRVTVVQALPKSDRSELAVELATEAGVDEIVPWQAARCVSRWVGPKAEKGVSRWRSAAVQAAKQSRRAWVPVVRELHTTAEVLAALRTRSWGQSEATSIVLHESAAATLSTVSLTGDVVLVVGPEGGMDDAELAAFIAVGSEVAHLGPTVMRTSTAAAVALGGIGALTGRWDAPPTQSIHV